MAMIPLWLPVAVFLAAWWLTGRFRRYALDRHLLDVPNARSSHAVATPRGGGMAIVLCVLAALPAMAALGLVDRTPVIAAVGGGAFVAALGFADDHGDIPMRWRLLGHFAAAGWVVAWLGGLPPLAAFGATVDVGQVGYGLAIVYLVWLLNVTNFMDGIDGIAAVEAITASLGAVLVILVTMPGSSLWFAPAVLAAASLGFLMWNWPPARIFMGDAGSGFLGLVLGTLSLQSAWEKPELFWSWLILLGVFAVDATFTRVRRATQSWRFYEPHRSHAYQHASRRWGSHRSVTVGVGAINILWLLPIALAVALGIVDGPAGVAVAYLPLVALAVWLKAGVSLPA